MGLHTPLGGKTHYAEKYGSNGSYVLKIEKPQVEGAGVSEIFHGKSHQLVGNIHF